MEQKDQPGSVTGLLLDFQSHTFQMHASSLAGDFPFHEIKIILLIADAM